MSSSFATLALCATFCAVCRANNFLQPEHPNRHEHMLMSTADVQKSIMGDVAEIFGNWSTTSRMKDLEALLRPMYAALPKNEYGRLGHPTVRYALHRLFVQRHGWFISGLEPAGGAWNSTSPTSILQDQVPTYIQDVFEKRLGDRGFGLDDLAVLAATIEHLIHTEATRRLGEAMRVHDLPQTFVMSVEQAEQVLDTYMVSYLLGEDLENMTADDAENLTAEMPEVYMAWPETRLFVRDTRRTHANVSEISFTMLALVAEKVGEEFGKFQDKECGRLKRNLATREERRGTGRVRLADFYKAGASEGDWQFHESIEYLRELGALDESDPNNKRVMVANYVNSHSNCIASSSFYSVCCMNECEGLLGHLEVKFAVPEVDPTRLLACVSNLSSSSVYAPRTLSATLRQHLDDIAKVHAGHVPLHGRLFAQWMHHAFPNECPYPHVAHSTRPKTPDEWEEAAGKSEITDEEIEIYLQDDANATARNSTSWGEDLDLPWSREEELLTYIPASHRARGPSAGTLLFAAVSSGAAGLLLAMEKKGDFTMAEQFRKAYV